MSNYFLSYKYTGESYDLVYPLLNEIEALLTQYGNDVFCSINLQNDFKKNEINTYDKQVAYCLKKQEKAETILGIIWSEKASKGMLKELIMAKKLKQKYKLYIKKGLKYPDFREYATTVHEFVDFDSLVSQIKALGLSS